MSNVCSGDADILMPMDHLTLAEYLEHPESLFPAEFGGQCPSPPPLESGSTVPTPEPFEVNPSSSSESSVVDSTPTPLGDISDRCYMQLDRFVFHPSLYS